MARCYRQCRYKEKIMAKRPWTRDEMIMTLALYFQLPFGRLNHATPEVRKLAQLLNRTENAVALRLVNFAACDPYIINSGRTGMPGGLGVCMPYWNEFANDRERLFLEAQLIKAERIHQSVEKTLNISELLNNVSINPFSELWCSIITKDAAPLRASIFLNY